jgi:hypothetical protein
MELRKDRDEEFRNGERKKEIREFMFPGGLGPSASVSGRGGTNVEIIEKEESINDCHVVEADGGDGGLSVFTVVSSAGVLKRHKHNIDQDFGNIRKYIDGPFVSEVGTGGGVALEEREYVGGRFGDFHISDNEFDCLRLQRSEAVRKRRLRHC